jgi:phosphoadenosine phosphosulfate reductase
MASLQLFDESSFNQAARWDEDLKGATPDDIIRFAVSVFGRRLAVATQLGREGCSLLHRVSVISPGQYVFMVDTGLLFHETHTLAAELEIALGLRIHRIQPTLSVGEQGNTHGPNMWERDPDACCRLRKVEPVARVLRNFGAWMTSLRKEQSASRASTPVVQWDRQFGLFKFAPLANVREHALERYIAQHQVPTNPLLELGYRSIGCMTCTSPVGPGESARAGRWAGKGKTECGLHVVHVPDAPQLV